ncbi:uncharacterized protein LOC131953708 [Physella acuta]|uniref:uncharacterized protein LOC131953708 n=1 Tax=Physella acuta TaxID=109671 RepID=UPI0027DC4328|nr:uncharacterized protein LOC131953708 [Physella acuta]
MFEKMFGKHCLFICLTLTLLHHAVLSTVFKEKFFDIPLPDSDKVSMKYGSIVKDGSLLMSRPRRATAQLHVGSIHAGRNHNHQQQQQRASRRLWWQKYNALRSGGQVLDA